MAVTNKPQIVRVDDLDVGECFAFQYSAKTAWLVVTKFLQHPQVTKGGIETVNSRGVPGLFEKPSIKAFKIPQAEFLELEQANEAKAKSRASTPADLVDLANSLLYREVLAKFALNTSNTT